MDAQAAKNLTQAYTLGRMGGMMTATELGDPLASAIVEQFPDRFPRDPNSAEAGFLSHTSILVQAYTLLGGAASSARGHGTSGRG